MLVRYEAEGTLQAVLWEGRRRVELLGAITTLEESRASTWRLHDCYISFHDGRVGGTRATGPPPSLTPIERIQARRDRTGERLQEKGEKIARLLDSDQAADRDLCSLLEWWAAAKRSPAPAQVVLCDRVLETSAAWAGADDLTDFIRGTVLPAWAYSQLWHAIDNLALQIWDCFERRMGPVDDVSRAIINVWEHPGLGLETDASGQLVARDPAGLIEHFAFIDENTLMGGAVRAAVEQLRPWATDTRSARRHLEALLASGERHEQRRRRTRNAFVHGGPQTPQSARQVAPFSFFAARVAIGLVFDARLTGDAVIDHAFERTGKLIRVRALLQEGVSPHQALLVD